MSKQEERDLFGPRHLSQAMPKANPPSRIKQRLIESAVQIEAEDPASILYQHTVFCQTGLPYRDPGHIRLWKRSQGAVHLEVEAGRAFHPRKADFIDVGLPFGPKPRLILAYLNGEALKTDSPVIEVEESLTAFVQRIGLCQDGRSIRMVKDQLSRLAASEIRLALAYGDQQARQVNAHIVGEFDLWFPKDARQRVLWPTTVTLDPRYFESLQRHAVPLDERAIAALSHSAMGLDIYAWLAQRLYRVERGKPAFIPWGALKEQFGHQYGRMDNFKRVFRQTLDMVLTQYRGARVEMDGRGMTLRNSPPPIKERMTLIRRA
jgi:Plasmid encoded RepA protein